MQSAELNPAVVAVLQEAEQKIAALKAEEGNDGIKLQQLLSKLRSEQLRFGFNPPVEPAPDAVPAAKPNKSKS
jgi:hypothetical protein